MNYPINCPVNHFIDYPSIPLMIPLIICKKSFPIIVGELSQAHSHSSETRWESHAFVEACRGWQGSLRDLSLGHMAWHQVDVGTWMCIPLSKWFFIAILLSLWLVSHFFSNYNSYPIYYMALTFPTSRVIIGGAKPRSLAAKQRPTLRPGASHASAVTWLLSYVVLFPKLKDIWYIYI